MAQEFQAGIDVADVYAAALFELAGEASVEQAVHDELRGLIELMRDQPGLDALFTSSAIDDDDREQSLERIFRGRLSDLVLNTLQVMNWHGRLTLLPQLLRAYVLRLEDARGQVEVVATSAVELDDAQRGAVRDVAEGLAGKQPLVEYLVDPQLIGGLVLQIGDYRYDNSIRRHLHAARARLHDRGERGLGVAAEAGGGPNRSSGEPEE